MRGASSCWNWEWIGSGRAAREGICSDWRWSLNSSEIETTPNRPASYYNSLSRLSYSSSKRLSSWTPISNCSLFSSSTYTLTQNNLSYLLHIHLFLLNRTNLIYLPLLQLTLLLDFSCACLWSGVRWFLLFLCRVALLPLFILFDRCLTLWLHFLLFFHFFFHLSFPLPFLYTKEIYLLRFAFSLLFFRFHTK